MSMVDWWIARGEHWGVRNLDFKVELYPDNLTTQDLDAYTGADQAELDRGAWTFVEIVVIPMDTTLVDHVGARQTLHSVEWGELSGGRIDRDDLMDQIRELAVQAVTELRRNGFELEIAEGSDFDGRLTAPF